MKKLASLIILILLGGVLVPGCSQQKQTQAPAAEAKKKLIVGTIPGYYPFQMMDKNGNLIGYSMDLCDQLSKYLDVELEFQGYDRAASLITALQANKVDFVISAITITDKRKEAVDFSEPYLEIYPCLAVTNKHKDLKSWNELDKPGMTIAVVLGSIYEATVEKMFKQAEIKKFDGSALATQAVANGQVDAFMENETFVKVYQIMNPDKITVLNSRLGNPEVVGIAVAKGNKELLDKINDFLKQYKENGSAAKNYEKWFESASWRDSVPPKKD